MRTLSLLFLWIAPFTFKKAIGSRRITKIKKERRKKRETENERSCWVLKRPKCETDREGRGRSKPPTIKLLLVFAKDKPGLVKR